MHNLWIKAFHCTLYCVQLCMWGIQLCILGAQRYWRNTANTSRWRHEHAGVESKIRSLFLQCSCCNEDYIMKLVWFSVVLLDTLSLQQKLSADVLHLKWLLYDDFCGQCTFQRCHMVTASQSLLSRVIRKHKNHRPSSVCMTFPLRQWHKKNTAHTWHESLSQPLQMTLHSSFHFRIFIIFLH